MNADLPPDPFGDDLTEVGGLIFLALVSAGVKGDIATFRRAFNAVDERDLRLAFLSHLLDVFASVRDAEEAQRVAAGRSRLRRAVGSGLAAARKEWRR